MAIERVASIGFANRKPFDIQKSDRERKFKLASLLAEISVTRRILDALKKSDKLKKTSTVEHG